MALAGSIKRIRRKEDFHKDVASVRQKITGKPAKITNLAEKQKQINAFMKKLETEKHLSVENVDAVKKELNLFIKEVINTPSSQTTKTMKQIVLDQLREHYGAIETLHMAAESLPKKVSLIKKMKNLLKSDVDIISNVVEKTEISGFDKKSKKRLTERLSNLGKKIKEKFTRSDKKTIDKDVKDAIKLSVRLKQIIDWFKIDPKEAIRKVKEFVDPRDPEFMKLLKEYEKTLPKKTIKQRVSDVREKINSFIDLSIEKKKAFAKKTRNARLMAQATREDIIFKTSFLLSELKDNKLITFIKDVRAKRASKSKAEVTKESNAIKKRLSNFLGNIKEKVSKERIGTSLSSLKDRIKLNERITSLIEKLKEALKKKEVTVKEVNEIVNTYKINLNDPKIFGEYDYKAFESKIDSLLKSITNPESHKINVFVGYVDQFMKLSQEINLINMDQIEHYLEYQIDNIKDSLSGGAIFDEHAFDNYSKELEKKLGVLKKLVKKDKKLNSESFYKLDFTLELSELEGYKNRN